MTTESDKGEKARKIIHGEVLLTLLRTAEANSVEVGSINGDFRNELKSNSENGGLNLKAWGSYRAVGRARKRSSADALILIEDIRLGLDVIEADILRQGDLLADQENKRNGKAAKEEDEFDAAAPNKAAAPTPPDPDADAASRNTAALTNGIAKKESQSAKAKRARQAAEKAAQGAVDKVLGDQARGLGPDAIH